MNLDQDESKSSAADKPARKNKLSRKEKKAQKNAEKMEKLRVKAEEAEAAKQAMAVSAAANPARKPLKPEEGSPEEVEASLYPSPVPEIPPPTYTTWEKISPPARRKKQISNMESGFREVLGLVHSMRNNQEVLLKAFQKLPEAVDSVKKLADHSAQQSDLLKAMNDQIGTGSAGEFTKTLNSMDKTTQQLLERSQRSEEQLYKMLRRAQRRIAFMTLMVLLLFLGAVAAGMMVFFPEKAEAWTGKKQTAEQSAESPRTPVQPGEVPEENPSAPPAPTSDSGKPEKAEIAVGVVRPPLSPSETQPENLDRPPAKEVDSESAEGIEVGKEPETVTLPPADGNPAAEPGNSEPAPEPNPEPESKPEPEPETTETEAE